MGVEHDLTGRWTGIFNYPSSDPPNSFEAELRDSGGLLTGLTTELDDHPYGPGEILHAVIDGRREGSVVRFNKRYDDFDLMPDLVHYDGFIHPGGDEIEGQWEIEGFWSGTFMMVRRGGSGEEVAEMVSETINLPTG